MRSTLCLSICAVVGLAPTALAQGVPWGQLIGSQSTTASTTNGLFLVDRAAGTCTDITGLSGNAEGLEAVQMDDVNKSIWLGSRGGTTLHNITLGAGGLTVATEANVATVTCNGRNAGVLGIAMSANNNPTCLVSTCVIEVDRTTFAQKVLFDARPAIPTGTLNGIAKHPTTGDLYFGLAGSSTTAGIFCLRRIPGSCNYAPAVRIGSIQPASASVSIQGLDICPRTNTIYWCSRTTAGNNIGSMPIATGIPASLGNPGPDRFNWVEYDQMRDDFVLVDDAQSGGASFLPGNRVTSWSKQGASSTICTVNASGTIELTSIDTSDCRTAQTSISPACPPVGVQFRLEISTCCPPGQQAGIFLVAPIAVPLVLGPVDATGRLTAAFSVALPPGLPPGFLVFASVCFDPTNGALVVGAPRLWPN